MKKFGKFLLVLAVLVLLGLASWAAALYMQWPLWMALAIFCGAVGLYFLVKFAHRVLLVMRSRSKLAQSDAQQRNEKASASTPEALLRRKWKEAVAKLRSSSLSRRGNPMYVLPWYMVIGKSGTGKTTALTRARLSSPLQKVRQNSVIEQTQDYDWWYFDQAVVIDCAGRYVDVQDGQTDRQEWELGLDLLARYRSKEGVDGLVLAVSVERLRQVSKDELIEEGRVVRARIEQLIQMFGKRFPIYVLVTKCDQLYGMEEWASHFPANALEQAMGFLSEDIQSERSETQFLEQAFSSINHRLQQLRIALVARADHGAVSPELLLLPNELQNLRAQLEMFLQATLADNPYLERPFLRGLFFSSARQEGGANSTVLAGAVPPVASHSNTNTGLFLHDFFGRILPQDRLASRPAELVNRWRQVTQHMGLFAWGLLALALGIMMTVSFVSNMETISLVRENRPFDARFTGQIDHDISELRKVSSSLQLLERRNEGWKTQWMVIATNIDDLEAKLKQSYVSNYRKYIQPNVVHNVFGDLVHSTDLTQVQELPLLIRNLVRDTNQLRARMNGAGLSALQQMPQLQNIGRYTTAQHQQITDLHLSHLAWTQLTDPYLSDRMAQSHNTLEHVAYADPQMRWLTGVVSNDALALPAVKEADFWNATTDASQQPNMVPAVFTLAGKKVIDDFLAEMEQAVEDGPLFLSHRAAFEAWYRDQRILAWQRFVASFDNAHQLLEGEKQWRAALGGITGAQSPYYRLLDRLKTEFQDYESDTLPSWLQLAYQLTHLRFQVGRAGVVNQAADQAINRAVKVVESINAVGGKAVRDALEGDFLGGTQTVLNNMSAAEVFATYQSEVAKLAADAVVGAGKSYELAAQFHQYGRDAAIKTSAVHDARDMLHKLKSLLGHADADDAFVWKLIEGPLDFTLAYIEQQTSCELQRDWQTNVHWPLQEATDKASMIEQLYGPKGTVWAFVDGIAKPFLARDAQRFRMVETLGYSIPMTHAFLPTLNAAVDKRVAQLVTQQRHEAAQQAQQLQAEQKRLQTQQQQEQIDQAQAQIKQRVDALKAQVTQLSIQAQPTGVNPGALSKPYETLLNVQCAAGAQSLANYNFPVGMSFPWAVGQCGEVSLQIKIDALVLTKKYPGTMGVANFLRDFRAGARQFSSHDFPAAKDALEALNINHVTVRYNFEGHDAILQTAQQMDAYEQLEKDTAAQKQKLADDQFNLAKENIQSKLAVHATTPSTVQPAEVFLPSHIGMCWDRSAMQGSKQEGVHAMIEELVQTQVSPARAATDSSMDSATAHTPSRAKRKP